MNIACIVEGHGESEAVPVLVRRVAQMQRCPVVVKHPIRLSRGKLVKQVELARAVQFAAKTVGRDGRILVLLDSDDDCPAELGPRLLRWSRAARADMHIAVVLAKREFEAWFLAAAESISGRRDLGLGLTPPQDSESLQDCKAWLSERMRRRYSPSIDQAALAAIFSVDLARERSESFAKLVRELKGWFAEPGP